MKVSNKLVALWNNNELLCLDKCIWKVKTDIVCFLFYFCLFYYLFLFPFFPNCFLIIKVLHVSILEAAISSHQERTGLFPEGPKKR